MTVVDPNTDVTVAYFGAQPNPNAVPARQMVFELDRSDGTPALILADLGITPGHAQLQALQTFDRAGNVVLADDTNGGEGLANPNVVGGGPVADTNVSTWPATTNTTWTTIADGLHEFQNPLLQWDVTLQADTSTTGEFRIQVAGTTVSTVQTVTAAFAYWSTRHIPRPAGVNIGDVAYVTLDAQRTAGTGTIRAIT